MSLTIDPNEKFVCVANGGSNNVAAYAINAGNGALTPIGMPVAAGTVPTSVTGTRSGKFAYVANQNSRNISTYAINSATALTAVGAPVLTGTDPQAITLTPNDKFAYVANVTSNNISAYAINDGYGDLDRGRCAYSDDGSCFHYCRSQWEVPVRGKLYCR